MNNEFDNFDDIEDIDDIDDIEDIDDIDDIDDIEKKAVKMKPSANKEVQKQVKKKRKAKKRKNAFMKVLPVIIAVVLILAVGGAFYGQKLMEKYSYGTEMADLVEYYGIEPGKLSIVYNGEKLEEKAKLIDGKAYFDEDFIKEHFTDHFYVNRDEQAVLYTTQDQTIKCVIGEDFKYYLTADSQVDLDYRPVVLEGDTLYFALDYLKLFVPIQADVYADPGYIVVFTETPADWKVASVNKDTAIRYQGGIKSPILENLSSGDEIYVIEEMEDWAKVASDNGKIGYLELKQFDYSGSSPDFMTGAEVAIPLEYTSIAFDGKINMAFHQVFADPASHFAAATENVKSVNIMAPTIFRFSDNSGSLDILPSARYVELAHEKGMSVWAVVTDVDSPDVDMGEVLESTANRRKVIEALITQANENNIDGINLDIETVSSDEASHFVQFLRELSVETHKNNIILSVDNYALASITGFYNRKEQGQVADYVIIMGYDEHWATSPVAGSVASIDYVDRGIRETIAQVAPEKVINAVPFYTRIWRTTEDGKVGCDTVGMPMQNDWVAQHGITPSWDNETCQNYAETMSGGKLCQVWMEDAESLEVKLNTMDHYNLAGVAEWKLGFETPDVWDVFEKYMTGTLNPEANKPAGEDTAETGE